MDERKIMLEDKNLDLKISIISLAQDQAILHILTI